MNKRQAKKQFKKRYGMTPDQMIVQLADALAEVTCNVIPEVVKALAAGLDAITEFLRSDAFREMVAERARRIEETPELVKEHFYIEEVTKNKEE